MKLLCSLAVLSCAVLSTSAQSKLDLSARMLIQNYERICSNPEARYLDPRVSDAKMSRSNPDGHNELMVGVVIKLTPGSTVDRIDFDEQVSVVSAIDDMAVLSLPLSQLEKLADIKEIQYVSAGSVKTSQMFFARSSGKVNKVHEGDELPQSFTGKGVVVGMMDQGLDPNHINFTDGTDYNTMRVKQVYAYSNTDGKPTKMALTPEEIKGFTSDMTTTSHGTHVMGIAAGSFNGASSYGLEGAKFTDSPMPYYGVATQADIVMTGGVLADANILNGVERVISYAESVGKPAVVNLSLGSILGPHDGTDATSQYLSKLGDRAIICVAAGNDGEINCAMKMSGGGGGIMAAMLKNNAVGLNVSSQATSPYSIQFWGNDSKEFTFDFVIYNVSTKQVVYSLNIPNTEGRGKGVGGSSTGSNLDKNDIFNEAFTASSYATFWSQVEECNNRYCVLMQCVLNRNSSSNTLLVPAVRITRTSGQSVYGYLNTSGSNEPGSFVKETGSGWKDLYWSSTTCSSEGSISDMATGSNIISVGAYTSSKYFTLENGSQYSYDGSTAVGQMCSFSSYGTNPITNETYPFVSAPGSAIVSSISNYDKSNNSISGSAGGNGRSNLWGSMQGTSMACPFVTGVMGLWLEADPSLTVDEARSIIAATAVPYTGSDSALKIKWGVGKLDALAGIKEVLRRKGESGGIDGVLADAEGYVVTPVGDRGFNVVVDGAGVVSASLYNLQGVAVARAEAQGNEVTLEADGVAPGVYVLSIETPNTARIARRILLR